MGAAPETTAAQLAPIFGHDLADQPPVAMRQLRALAAHDVSSRLGELADIPTLVVSAEHDMISRPEYGRAIAAGIPGARYVEIAGAAHGVPITDAPQINALLSSHFEAADGAGKV